MANKFNFDSEKLKSLWKTNSSKSQDLRNITPELSNFDTDHLLHDKFCTFTGKLERMARKDAAQLVVNLGGKCLNGVTKQTNFLILGNFEYNATIKDGKSSKLKKAEKLILEGQDLRILSENVFYDLISNK
jgi:DNA polymerase-3 subunit epsilon